MQCTPEELLQMICKALDGVRERIIAEEDQKTFLIFMQSWHALIFQTLERLKGEFVERLTADNVNRKGFI